MGEVPTPSIFQLLLVVLGHKHIHWRVNIIGLEADPSRALVILAPADELAVVSKRAAVSISLLDCQMLYSARHTKRKAGDCPAFPRKNLDSVRVEAAATLIRFS